MEPTDIGTAPGTTHPMIDTTATIRTPARLNPDAPEELDRKVRQKLAEKSIDVNAVFVRTARILPGGTQHQTNARIPYMDYAHDTIVGASDPCAHISEVRAEGAAGVLARMEWTGTRGTTPAAAAGLAGDATSAILARLQAIEHRFSEQRPASNEDPEERMLAKMARYKELFTPPPAPPPPSIKDAMGEFAAMLKLAENVGMVGPRGGAGESSVAVEIIRNGPTLIESIGAQIKQAILTAKLADIKDEDGIEPQKPDAPAQPVSGAAPEKPKPVENVAAKAAGEAKATKPAGSAKAKPAPTAEEAALLSLMPPEAREGLKALAKLVGVGVRARDFNAETYGEVIFDALEDAGSVKDLASLEAEQFVKLMCAVEPDFKTAEARKRITEMFGEAVEFYKAAKHDGGDDPDDGSKAAKLKIAAGTTDAIGGERRAI